MKSSYTKKMVQSGDIYEVFEYEKPIVLGKVSNAQGRSLRADDETKAVIRKKTMSKAKTTLRRLINANVGVWGELPKFMTLTFAENVTDVKQANYEFKKFRQRLEYKLNLKLKYAVVIEFQKRGAVHYHAVFFNMPFIDVNELAEIWGQGFIKLNKIDQVDNVGAYVTKYMTKDATLENDRLIGEKSYFTSRGLHKPQETLIKEKIEQLEVALSEHETYCSTFENDYLGKIVYKQYNIKR